MTFPIARIHDIANSINAMCDARGIEAIDDPVRVRMHHYHGEMLSRGCYDPDEILRVIEAALDESTATRARTRAGVDA